MIVPTPTPVCTYDEYLNSPFLEGHELVDGQLVEVHVSVLSSGVAARAIIRLGAFTGPRKLGELLLGADALVRCFPGRPNTVRKPDVCFVRRERLPAGWMDASYLGVAPDLVVEVLSPNDLAYEVDEKIRQYLEAGIPLVWIVNPVERWVYVHRRDGTVTRLVGTDMLRGDDVLPGFECSIADLFPEDAAPPDAATRGN